MSGKERLEVSTLMDHSIETNITVYDKSEPSMKLKKGKYVKL
jgi:hypothetical protein